MRHEIFNKMTGRHEIDQRPPWLGIRVERNDGRKQITRSIKSLSNVFVCHLCVGPTIKITDGDWRSLWDDVNHVYICSIHCVPHTSAVLEYS